MGRVRAARPGGLHRIAVGESELRSVGAELRDAGGWWNPEEVRLILLPVPAVRIASPDTDHPEDCPDARVACRISWFPPPRVRV